MLRELQGAVALRELGGCGGERHGLAAAVGVPGQHRAIGLELDPQQGIGEIHVLQTAQVVPQSDLEEVVGYSTTSSGDLHAFRWTAAGGAVDLGTLDLGTLGGAEPRARRAGHRRRRDQFST